MDLNHHHFRFLGDQEVVQFAANVELSSVVPANVLIGLYRSPKTLLVGIPVKVNSLERTRYLGTSFFPTFIPGWETLSVEISTDAEVALHSVHIQLKTRSLEKIGKILATSAAG